MRPKSIVAFELIILITLVIGAVQAFITFDSNVAAAEVPGIKPALFVILTQAFAFVLVGGLTLLISRRRSRVAMWISIVLFVVGMVFSLQIFQSLAPLSKLIFVVQSVAQLVAYGLLFTPMARRWMRNAG
jgi:hypothetical protein